MTDEMLTISKHDLIDILTKSGIFNANGIEVVLSRDGLKGVLSGMMVTVDSFRSRADHYKNEYSRLKETVRELESLIDKYEDMTKGESDFTDLGWGDDDDYDILELRDQWDDCDDD